MSHVRQRGEASGLTDRDRWVFLGIVLAVFTTSFLSYLPAFRGAYVQDDHVVVEANPIVERGSLREVFTTDYWGEVKGNDQSLYRPVTILTWAAERAALGRPSPFVSHAVNVSLHALISLLLLALARRIGATIGAGTAAALLFSVHPVHVEAVANVVGRSDLLAALFTLAAILCHSAPTRSRVGGWAAALATGACVFLALCSKEVAIVLPFLLIAFDLYFRAPRRGGISPWLVDRAVAFAPALVAVGTYFQLRTLALGSFWRMQVLNSTDNRLVLLDGVERIATSLGVAARYLGLFIFPVGLSCDRSGDVIQLESSLLAPRALIGLAWLAMLAVVLVLPLLFSLRENRERVRGAAETLSPPGFAQRAAFAAALFLFPYLVVGNLLVLIRATVADRLLYVPSLGLCILAAEGIARLPWRRVVAAAFLVVLIVLATGTWLGSRTWRDEESLFGAALRATPKSPRALFVLGNVRVEQGRHEEALAFFERSHQVWPDFIGAWVNAATELTRLGRLAEAEARLREAIARDPQYGAAYHNLGLVLGQRGRMAEAERALRKATLYDPSLFRAWAQLGHIYFDSGRFRDAARAYGRAVALGRDDLRKRLHEANERLSRAP